MESSIGRLTVPVVNGVTAAWLQGINRMRRGLKHAFQHLATLTGPRCWAGQGRLLTLMYHRVLPAQHPDMPWVQPGMYVSPDTLRQHIDWLREYFELVDLQDWLDAVRERRPVPRRACALTFDDGWLDNYEHAWPILRAEQAPATMFVVTSLVGSQRSFWPERLARLVWSQTGKCWANLATDPWRWLLDLDPEVFQKNRHRTRIGIDRLVQAAKRRYADQYIEQRIEAIEQYVSSTGSNRDLADWSELKEMVDSGWIRLGSHTRHHVRLRDGVPTKVLIDEIVNSSKEIEANTGMAPGLFCYPNGERSAEAIRLVSAQYRAAVTTDRGWNSATSDPHQLRRIGLHQDISSSRTAFIARLSGWM